MQTQWRTGMGGATGLDYAGVIAYLREAIPRRSERAPILEAIQACELAVLEVRAESKT